MDQQAMRDILSGRTGGLGPAFLRAAAWAASKPYSALMRLRRRAYRLGVLPAHKAPVPVISIGNLTVGGTGKTPMAAWAAGVLKRAGRNPAILIRGYKAQGGRSDEAELLWQLTGCPVVAEADRVSAAEAAAGAGADVLILDDGFQHRRLRRDLDIVLVDATNPFGHGHVLPRGLLREPPSALGDADVIVITRSDLAEARDLEALRKRLAELAPRAAVHAAAHEVQAVVADHGRRLPPGGLAGKRVCAFCGLGNPEAFFATCRRAGAVLAEQISFADHAAYGPAELGRIAQAAAAAGVEAIVTTAKDRVKIEDASALPAPLWTVQVEMQVVEGREALIERIVAAARAG